MSLVRNEQTKLTASWLNAISAASIAVGGFAQLAPLFSGTVVAPSPIGTALFTAVWFAIGFVLHIAGRMMLRRLEE
jgi:hypothetical protein